VRRKLVDDARDLAQVHGPMHGIIIAGDVAFAGQPEEYRRATEWLEELAKATGAPQTAVYMVPGNHDVNMKRVSVLTSHIHTYYRGLPLNQLAQELSQLEHSEHDTFLVEKLRDYHEFASAFDCHFGSSTRPWWTKDVLISDGRLLRLTGLTSVQISDLNDTKAGLILGANQYTIQDEPSIEYLAILHHPFEWLKDERDVETYLTDRARIIIVGHEHISRIRKITTGTDRDYLLIDSGAATPPEDSSPYTYHYNLLVISQVELETGPNLHVLVYPRVWSGAAPRFVADRAGIGDREVAPFDLRCPQYARGIANRQAPPTSDGVALLRYYFWRDLDWGQRIAVLSRLGHLSDPSGHRWQHTIEREALDRATTPTQLSALWKAIMSFRSQDKRLPSPFAKGRR
jgi:predicted phosphodiesterase